MKRTTRWTTVLICLPVLLVSVPGTWAAEQGKVSGKTKFERFHESFGVAQIKPSQRERLSQMSRRRIILNDDGEVTIGKIVWDAAYGQYGETIEQWLAVRFNPAEGTQVDSYFFNIAATDRGPVVDGEVITNPQSTMAQFYYWGEPGEIHPATERATRALIKHAHDAGMEIFASIRMNDTHDSYAPKLTYPLKIQGRDLLLGKRGLEKRPEAADALMRLSWSGLDYAKPEVRQHFLDFILSYCRQYEYDGVELDYFRMPVLFKLGEEEENLDNMTEFVRQVRQGLNEIGRERGKPYLLTVRALDDLKLCLMSGLDVEQWLKEGLLDLLIVGGGYMPYAGRLKELIDMAHHYGVPAYPCMNRMGGAGAARSKASNFWALGGDGVYIFNYAGVPDGSAEAECLDQLGAPEILLGLDKQYVPDNGHTQLSLGYTQLAPQFPVRLIDGTPIELVVGDDVQKATEEAILEAMRLQVKVGNMDESEGITINMNGAAVPVEGIKRVDAETFEAVVTAPPVRRGINQIVVLPGLNSIGRLSSTVTWLKLSVRYQHD